MKHWITALLLIAGAVASTASAVDCVDRNAADFEPVSSGLLDSGNPDGTADGPDLLPDTGFSILADVLPGQGQSVSGRTKEAVFSRHPGCAQARAPPAFPLI